jgi:hypothetical protein
MAIYIFDLDSKFDFMMKLKYSIYFLALFSFVGCSYQAVDLTELDKEGVIFERKYIELSPETDNPATCFLFYPGALVEPEAYIQTFSIV